MSFFCENYVQTFLYFFEGILQDMGYFFRISGGKFKTKEILKPMLPIMYSLDYIAKHMICFPHIHKQSLYAYFLQL